MKFILNKNALIVENREPVHSGSLAYYEAEVERDTLWSDLNIELVMVRGNEKGTSTAVIGNKVYVDQNLEGYYSVGFVGYKLEGDKKVFQVSTGLKTIAFDKGAGEIETEEQKVPTPTEWEIYNAQIQEFIRQGQVVVNEANNLNVELKDNLLTITKKDGTQYSENVKGEKGDKGDAGSIKFIIVNELPTENIDESAMYLKPSTNPEEQNTYEEYVYVSGVWESLGSAKVEVNLEDYVKNTDYAANGKAGIIKLESGTGIWINSNNALYVAKALNSEIDSKKNNYKPIVPANLDYAVGSVFPVVTQAEYDALVEAGTVNENLYYCIKEE